MKKIIVLALMCVMVSGAVFARGAQAAEDPAANFPNKPVQAMMAWAAGGGGDLVFRALAEVFPKYANGQPLVIVNKGEAAGVPGIMDFKQNGTADGYWVMHWNIAHVIKTHWDEVPFTSTEFTPVCKVVEANEYLLVPANSKYNTLADFIADAKANPGQIVLGNAGIGGGNHLAAVLFEKAAGIQLRHMPFSGGGPAVTGALTGDCQAVMAVAPEGISQVQGGQAKILAVFAANRLADFPNVPTGKEAGLDFIYDQWRGVVVPAGTPEAIVLKLQNIFKQCVEDPAYIERMKSMSATAAYADAKVYGDLVVSEDTRLEEVIKTAKIGNRYK